MRGAIGRLLFLFLSFCSLSSLFSQKVIEGYILNSANGSPIPYVSIYASGFKVGTVSNNDGNFRLRLPNNVTSEEVQFSCVGFQTISRTFSFEHETTSYKIWMKENIAMLNEVVVSPADHAEKLIRAAINNISKNYPMEAEAVEYFNRLTSYADTSMVKPFYLIEALTKVEIPPYDDKKKRNPSVQVLQSRKFEFERIDSLKTRFYNGLHIVQNGNVISQRSDIFNLSSLKYFDMEIVDTIQFQNTILYKIRFESASVSGTCSITGDQYAIAQLEIKHDYLHLSKKYYQSGDYRRLYEKYKIDYQWMTDAWRLALLTFESLSKNADGKVIFMSDKSILTGHTSLLEKIKYQDQLQYRDVVLDRVGVYDSTYWNDWNIILPDQRLAKILKEQVIKQPSDTLSQWGKLLKIRSRFRISIGLSRSQYALSYSSVSYNRNGQNLISNVSSENDSPLYGIRIATMYEISKNIIAGYEAISGLESEVFSNINGFLKWEIAFARNRRPIYLGLTLRTGYIQIREYVGTFTNPENLALRGKSFDSEETDSYVELRGWHVTPSASFALEINHRFRFFGEIGYNFVPSYTSGLYFVENKPVFKKRAFVKNDNSDVSIISPTIRSKKPFLALGITWTP